LIHSDEDGKEERAFNNSPSVQALARLAATHQQLVVGIQEELAAAQVTQCSSPKSSHQEPFHQKCGAAADASAPVSTKNDADADAPPSAEALAALAHIQARLSVAETVFKQTVRALEEEQRAAIALFRSQHPEHTPQAQRARARASFGRSSTGFAQSPKSVAPKAAIQVAPKALLHAEASKTSKTLDKFFQRATLSERLALDNERLAKLPPLPSKPTPATAIAASLNRVKSRRPARMERQFAGRFDKEERDSIRYSERIVAEQASPDSVQGRQVNKDGYEEDDFCVDDSFRDLVSDDEASDDDESCTTLDSEMEPTSDEDDFEAEARSAAIYDAFERTKAKSKSSSFLYCSCSPAELQEHRSTDIDIKKPTARTPLVELILTAWLRTDIAKVKIKHIEEFLRLLKLTPLEYALSIYYALAKRIRPVSNSFYQLLFRCIANYLPDHIPVFGRAHRDVWEKEKASNKAPDAASTPTMHSATKPGHASLDRRKPSTRAPQVSDIHNIKEATGAFYNAYKAYDRVHVTGAASTTSRCLNA
jgi:hypothetical protein